MPGCISPEALKHLLQDKESADFILVDVRKPAHYELDHIPGAVNIPVWQVDAHAVNPLTAGQVIFYCRNGVQSKAAALFACEAGLDPDRVVNLDGGIAAFTGEILLEAPRVVVFDRALDLAGFIETAIQLEKGAYLFYQKILPVFEKSPGRNIIQKLGAAEMDHAHLLYTALTEVKGELPAFKPYFRACSGDLLEGGRSMAEIVPDLDPFFADSEKDLEPLLDLALEVEWTAYDLYQNMAVSSKQPRVKKLFQDLSQAEKLHLAGIIACLGRGD